jgi:uncharacterized protein (TIGR02594 family)
MCQVVIPSSRVLNPSRSISTSESDLSATQTNANRFPRNYESGLRDGDLGTGFYGGTGGPGNSGNFVQYNQPLNPPPKDTLYGSLDYVLQEALKQNWAEQGSPANPNIKNCYLLCGRDYNRDGSDIAYAWCAAFVSYMLEQAGIENLRTMGSQVYANYGRPVSWRNLESIRKNDIVVFKSKTRSGGHVGFVQAIDPQNRKVACLGGNQSDTVNITNYGFDTNSQYILEIRRNWDIPADFDKPLVRSITGTTASGAATV